MSASPLLLRALSPRRRARLTPYLLLAPAFLLLGAIIFYPLARAVWLSFQSYSLTEPQNQGFIGLRNYETLFRDATFWQAAGYTARWVVVNVVAQLLIGCAFALVLNESFRGRAVVRGLILVPWVMPSSVTGLMWTFMFDGQFGIVNKILVGIGLIDAPIPFLSRPEWALWAIIVANVWYGVPFFTVMLLAGLQSIPPDYYEAASVDGASAWQRFWGITLPLWRPMILIVTLLRTIWLSQYVEVIYIMTGGGPVRYSTTIPVYGYVTSILKLDFGYAAAIAVSLAAVMMLVAYGYVRLARRLDISLR
jgi:multiple sugar transport system permease protein